MRTLKELFQLLLETSKVGANGTLHYSICWLIKNLIDAEIITWFEYLSLKRYIESHRPKWYSKHYSFKWRNNSYYWEPRSWKPRERWIKAQIKKLK
jgi:hypothetical protein